MEAWASLKSFRHKCDLPPEGGGSCNLEVDFHGEKRLNRTHASTTDPEARRFHKAKGKAAKVCFMGQVLMRNRHSLVSSSRLTPDTDTAEREGAAGLVEAVPGQRRITLAPGKSYDTQEFIQSLRASKAVLHLAQNCNGQKSAINGRATPRLGYTVSQ